MHLQLETMLPSDNNPSERRAATATAAATTRVCIKNLPVQYTEKQLREFLHKQLSSSSSSEVIVTDCRILQKGQRGTAAAAATDDRHTKSQSRRMAFVGFANPATASACVQKLHRAYCGTAKLTVEHATALVLPTKKRRQREKAAMEETMAEEATKVSDEKVDRKKEEFLAAMGISTETSLSAATTTGRKFWANDDTMQEQKIAEDNDADDSAKQQQKGDDEISTTTTSSSGSNDSQNHHDQVETPKQEVANRSALEFLRSKTVQANDLEDDMEGNAAEDSSSERESSSSSTSSDNDDEELPMAVGPKPQVIDRAATQDTLPNANGSSSEENGNDSSDKISQNRLFLRNLPFSATEDDIRDHLQEYGIITECHVAVDDRKQSKGFAFVTFDTASSAQSALEQADGYDFQGRLLHILPARKAPDPQAVVHGDSKNLTYKQRMEAQRQQKGATLTAGWSASFVRGDAVVDNLADRLGLRKGDILNVRDGLSAGDAAVRLALGETAVIEENRKYFAEHNIDMEALVSLGGGGSSDAASSTSTERSKNAILVKNLPFDTTIEELHKVFQGEDISILLPPSRTIAVVEYGHPNDAKSAFRKLAYRRFKSVPLYLEWAPLASKMPMSESDTSSKRKRQDLDAVAKPGDQNDLDEEDAVVCSGPTTTVFVKNLNFVTTETSLKDFFAKHASDVRMVRIPKKVAPVKRHQDSVKEMSMGFGFVEFGSADSAKAALKKLQGKLLDGHALELKVSHNQKLETTNTLTKTDKMPLKLMVRNVPFQATRKELLQLFGSFGQLKKIRLPKKYDGGHRGFAFIEYINGKEAESAMKSLSRTHLYGRHLVIEWAAEDEELEDLQILREKAERDIAPRGKKIRFE